MTSSTMTDVNMANSQLEDWLIETINTEAPLKTIQMRAHFSNWIQEDTKEIS